MYAWGLSDPQDLPAAAIATNDIRAVGLQVLPTEALTGAADASDRALIFAVNTYGKWSSASSNEFDIAIYGKNKTRPTTSSSASTSAPSRMPGPSTAGWPPSRSAPPAT